MPKPTAPWFHSLTESVYALGAAAREYRTANQAARTASWHIDPLRLLPVDGTVSVVDRDYIRPHDDAVWKIGDLYSELGSRTKKLYENAALAYAYGTTAVLVSVLKGERPSHIELGRGDGLYVLPPIPLPDLSEELGNWRDSQGLSALRQNVAERECAVAAVNDLLSCEDLADYESADMTHASEVAAGLADSAYAYGEQAESALHFALIASNPNHTPEEGQ
jgi:hypothetical protein